MNKDLKKLLNVFSKKNIKLLYSSNFRSFKILDTFNK